MKRISLLFFVLFSFAGISQQINWMTMEQAIEAQKKKPKKIFMDAYTVWCGPCKMLERSTFSNKDFVEYINKNYYAVKFNAEGNEVVKYNGQTYKNSGYDPSRATTRNYPHDFAQALEIRSYPTMMIFDEKAAPLTPLTGYMTAKQLEPILKLFSDDTYKKINTQQEYEAYMKDFKSTFSE